VHQVALPDSADCKAILHWSLLFKKIPYDQVTGPSLGMLASGRGGMMMNVRNVTTTIVALVYRGGSLTGDTWVRMRAQKGLTL